MALSPLRWRCLKNRRHLCPMTPPGFQPSVRCRGHATVRPRLVSRKRNEDGVIRRMLGSLFYFSRGRAMTRNRKFRILVGAEGPAVVSGVRKNTCEGLSKHQRILTICTGNRRSLNFSTFGHDWLGGFLTSSRVVATCYDPDLRIGGGLQ